MVASPTIYSGTKPTVHDCAHLDTCEYYSGPKMTIGRAGKFLRVCRTCGEKDEVLNLENHFFSVLNRPESLVTQITKDEYLAIEKSFDKKKPEYRERVLRQIREALSAHVLTADELRVFWSVD